MGEAAWLRDVAACGDRGHECVDDRCSCRCHVEPWPFEADDNVPWCSALDCGLPVAPFADRCQDHLVEAFAE